MFKICESVSRRAPYQPNRYRKAKRNGKENRCAFCRPFLKYFSECVFDYICNVQLSNCCTCNSITELLYRLQLHLKKI